MQTSTALIPTTSLPMNSTAAAYQANTNETLCDDNHIWEWMHSIQPPYILIISVLGILGNLFVLLVFCLHKTSRTVAEIYLSNLAAADLVLVSCLPFWAVNVAHGFDWPFASFMCPLVILGIKINANCSIYFMVLVSVDRYVALVHPMSHGMMRRRKWAKLGCVLVWGLGLLLSTPTLMYRRSMYISEHDVTACSTDYPNFPAMLACDSLAIVFGCLLPGCVISYCTFKIVRALKKQGMERFNAENTERKATRLVLAVLLAFLICWVPFHLNTIVDVFLRAEVLHQPCPLVIFVEVCSQIFTFMAFFNSVINPMLYVIVGRNFRKKVREVFEQLFKRRVAGTDSVRSHLSSTLKTLA
ncbi:B2 bradykinin receptor-like [Gadus chalcogrammus]|uniref:B2 bradykinin receptor-like n=1 Tax=Gadus chalcogrammus TaxID=1042646 RepID=UPI0024C32AC5|nr:B2 bradykinin receptor-like [Gadus chalcogrammus]